jgi:hypothetical protein
MADAIVALIKDPVRRDQLGAHAHETLLKRFLWQDKIEDYIAAYEGRPSNPLLVSTADSADSCVLSAERAAAFRPLK